MDLALNNLNRLICHKTQTNQTKRNLNKFLLQTVLLPEILQQNLILSTAVPPPKIFLL